jgi:hypothetical protein
MTGDPLTPLAVSALVNLALLRLRYRAGRQIFRTSPCRYRIVEVMAGSAWA